MSDREPPTLQHTSRELRKIADLLDVLNSEGEIGFVGSLSVYWSDVVQGLVKQTEDDGWTYYPCDVSD